MSEKKGMTSIIFHAVVSAVASAASYAICRASNLSNSFEKSVLVTAMLGFQMFAKDVIKHLQSDTQNAKPTTRILSDSAVLLSIPCALYAGRIFNFKAVDYLQLSGLTYIGLTLNSILFNVLDKLASKGSK